jgi:hypothetical protein
MKRITRHEQILSGEDKGTAIDIVPMSIDDIKRLQYGQRVLIHTGYFGQSTGGIIHVKINGKPKVWKTRPNDVSVPIKYGLYEYNTVDYRDGAMDDQSLWFAEVISA